MLDDGIHTLAYFRKDSVTSCNKKEEIKKDCCKKDYNKEDYNNEDCDNCKRF